MHVGYAIVFVSDMARSVAFYRDQLGLPLKFESPGWSEFATGGATLALHAATAPGGEDGGAPGGTPAGRCVPGLCVEDLAAFHHRMEERGVPCTRAPTVVEGVRLAEYRDPDGLAISVSERPGAD